MRHCKKRGNVNLDGFAGSKRPLFWMIVAIAAACSVLRERAAFATSWGSSQRTLLQLFFLVLGLCHVPWSQSAILCDEREGWKLQVP